MGEIILVEKGKQYYWYYLATKGAESEGIEKAPIAYLASVGDAFSRSGLRPLIQENHFSAVDYVGLNRSNIQILLNFSNSDNIVVRRPPYLRFETLNQRPNKQWGTVNQSIAAFTWITRWSLWGGKQSEQRGPLVQSKQYILHSVLCESAWILQWPKNFSTLSRGFSHGGHRLFSSSGPCVKKIESQWKA